MIQIPSPNYNDRPDGMPINSIIIHYTGMETAQDALGRLCDPQSEVSAHYTIDMDGTIYNHVDPQNRAWHAGFSQLGDLTNFNDFSIGIELVNKGHEFGYHAFPDAQIDALVELMNDLFQKYPIDPELVLGHSDIAPNRKQDPGELFPWERLITNNLKR